MNILLVSPHFPPRYIGGVEIYAKRLADALLASGDRPAVVTAEDIDSAAAGIQIQRDQLHGYPVHRLSGRVVGPGERFGLSYRNPDLDHAVNRILDDIVPDVIHLHSGYLLGGAVLAAARRRQIPIVVTLHDFWFICPRITMVHPTGEPCTGPDSAAKCAWCLKTEQRRYRVMDAATRGVLGRAVVSLIDHQAVASSLARWEPVRSVAGRQATLLNHLDHVDVTLCPSRFLRNQMVRAGMPEGRIHVSRYGIEIRPVARTQREDGAPLRVGYLGQIAPHKGVHHLVEAARQLPPGRATVRIYGDLTRDPAYAGRLRRLAEGGGCVSFENSYTHDRVYDILADLDVIVVPSVWYENAPFVIQEAQASGVPVVASRLGGMQELVADDRDGLLFEAGNPGDLARQLRRLIEDRPLLERLRPGRSSVRSAEDELEELRGHYRRLLRKPSRPAPPASFETAVEISSHGGGALR